MIVKFLAKSKTFKGVRYNTNKVDKNKGELTKLSGFGPLQGLSQLMPQDYINYLKLISSRNKRINYPQLHTVISAKGKEKSKEELTLIAEKWLKQMGYAEQPYLIIFHKDTHNHHVHIVSTRVDKTTGKKISSAFEKIRAQTAMNKIMKIDPIQKANNDLEKAMKYNFQTKAQFMMILESQGYTFTEKNNKLQLIKFGRKLLEIDPDFLKERKSSYQVNQARASQITAFLYQFRQQYSAQLRPETIPLPGGLEREKITYASDLSIYLKDTFGIHLIFHGKLRKSPYGYSVLDHAKGNVFKGGELMDLEVLTENLGLVPESAAALRTELTANIPYQPHEMVEETMPLSLDDSFSPKQTFVPYEEPIDINISDDVDDEAIHGRNRQRKRQTQTNTR